MKRFASSCLLATFALASCTTPTPDQSLVGTHASAQPAAYRAPRIPGTNIPDFNGVWRVLNTANYNIEAHPASAALQLRPGPYVPVPAAEVVALGAIGAVPAGIGIVQGDGKIPYTPEALKQRDENRARAVELDPEVKCYLPGVPRANYMDKPFQIFQSEKAFFIAYEYAGAVRNVFLEDPGEAPVDSWMGQSWGRWDGDTFVVEVTGMVPDTWLDRSGNLHGSSEVYTKPWTIGFNLYRAVGEDAQLQQFKCVEFVEELMYGHLRKNPLPGPALERAKREAEERAREGS
jgi:hypothetical protein